MSEIKKDEQPTPEEVVKLIQDLEHNLPQIDKDYIEYQLGYKIWEK